MCLCVPNISEGRDIGKVKEIVSPLGRIKGVKLLHVDCGKDSNRSVISFVGEPEKCLEGCFRLVEKSYELIDILKQEGNHPKVGALDVCPFVPLYNLSMRECVELSKRLAKEVSNKFSIPVFLYAESTYDIKTKTLFQIRKGGVRGLERRLELGKLKATYGENKINKKFGALITGARELMIAFNVTLDSNDVEIAKKIASYIRENPKERNKDKNFFPTKVNFSKYIGLEGVQAIGWEIPSRSLVQVSMNLRKPDLSGMDLVYKGVTAFSKYFGVNVLEGELIGLVSKKHLEKFNINSTTLETAITLNTPIWLIK